MRYPSGSSASNDSVGRLEVEIDLRAGYDDYVPANHGASGYKEFFYASAYWIVGADGHGYVWRNGERSEF